MAESGGRQANEPSPCFPLLPDMQDNHDLVSSNIVVSGGVINMKTKMHSLVLIAVALTMMYFLVACNSRNSDETAKPDIGGTWRTTSGSVVHFYQDGTGKTEDEQGTHEFTWEVVGLNDAISQRRGFRFREHYRTLSDSAERSNTSWGSWEIGGLDDTRPDDWGTGDYVVALTFTDIDIPFDFAFTLEGRDNLIINTMNLGQLLAPQANIDLRFEWITFTRAN